MSSWDLIRVFLALHRGGSYAGAAEILGMDASTTRRKLQTLEANLGWPLFVRHEGQVVLAPDQEVLLQAALQMEAAAQMFDRQAQGGQRGGTVRLSTLDIVAGLLGPHLGDFAALHPQVILDISTEPHFVDFEREMIDLALRLARPTKGAEGMKRLATISFNVFGSDAYFARHPARPGERHDILSLSANFPHHDHEFELAEEQWFRVQHRIGQVVSKADSYMTNLALCRAGLGLAMLPDYLAAGAPELQLFDPGLAMQVDLWILIRKDLAKMPKIRAAVEFISGVFRQLAPLLQPRELPRRAAM